MKFCITENVYELCRHHYFVYLLRCFVFKNVFVIAVKIAQNRNNNEIADNINKKLSFESSIHFN